MFTTFSLSWVYFIFRDSPENPSKIVQIFPDKCFSLFFPFYDYYYYFCICICHGKKIIYDINTLTDAKWLNLFVRIKSDLYSNIIIFLVFFLCDIYGVRQPLSRTCFCRGTKGSELMWAGALHSTQKCIRKNVYGCVCMCTYKVKLTS